jgi:recombinase
MVTIAHRLNEEGVLPPCSRGWAPSGIREMLYRGAYRGEVTWGKLQEVTRKGTKRQQHRPMTEWLTVSVPALKIIPEDLAHRVAARLGERAAIFPRRRDRKTADGSPAVRMSRRTCSRGSPVAPVAAARTPSLTRSIPRFPPWRSRRRSPL